MAKNVDMDVDVDMVIQISENRLDTTIFLYYMKLYYDQ